MSIKKFEMSLKKRISVALACTLLAGAVVVTLPNKYSASSTNRVDMVPTVSKNTELKGGMEPNLVLELNDRVTTGAAFYVELENAEWLIGSGHDEKVTVRADNSVITDFTVNQESKNVISVTINEVEKKDGTPLETVPADDVLRINLRTLIKGETAVAHIDPAGTTLTEDSVTFAKVASSGLITKVSSINTFYEEGTIDDITIEEPYPGSFASETKTIGNTEYSVITLDLDSRDFEFKGLNRVSVIPTKGFRNIDASKIEVKSVDDTIVEVRIPKTELDKCVEKGGLRISGLSVSALDDNPSEGNLSLIISGSFSSNSNTLTVAKIVSSGLTFKVEPVDRKYKDFLPTGRGTQYKIHIKETLKDTLVNNRTLYFELDKGFFFDAETTNARTAISLFEKEISLPKGMSLQSIELDDTYIKGFTVTIEANNDEIDEYSIKVPASAGLSLLDIFNETDAEDKKTEDKKDEDEGDSKVSFGGGTTAETTKDKDKKEELEKMIVNVTGRAISNNNYQFDLTKIKEPVTIDIEENVYKVGLKDQEGTDIVIQETEAGMINKGVLFISFDNISGLSFTSAPTVEVTKGDLKLGKGELVKENGRIVGIKFNITRPSKTPSTITISDVLVTADRTVPEGRVGLEIKGSAITDNESVASKTYAKMTASNIDDSTADLNNKVENSGGAGLNSKVSVTFAIGSKEYIVDGQKKTMDAEPYLSKNGRVMVPVRYLADAIGVSQKQILSNNGIVTIISGPQVIQVKAGSNIMVVNGSQIPMDEKTAEKSGRTYVPISFIASALNINSTYDQSGKTVTFSRGEQITSGNAGTGSLTPIE